MKNEHFTVEAVNLTSLSTLLKYECFRKKIEQVNINDSI